MGYGAAIFDMDGTILDTLEDMRDSVNASLRQAGFPERTTEEVRAFVGNGAWMLIRRAVPSGTSEAAARRVLDWYRPYYQAHAAVKTAPYPGVEAALAALRGAGMKLAVVSNKPDPTARDLAERYFPGLFDVVLGAREGLPVKPAPDALLEALRLLGVSAAAAVYVGDSDVDIATAENAGMPCVSVTWGFRDEGFLRRSGGRIFAHDAGELRARLLPDPQ